MASAGSTFGTVVRWDEERHGGLIEAPGLPGGCWVDESVVVRRGARGLRAGQVVEVDWIESPDTDPPRRATRVVLRTDLQGGLGG
jgi:cold shock CspA family protein